MGYTRYSPFGTGKNSIKSIPFERRDKRSFRRWIRRRIKDQDQKELMEEDNGK